MKVLSLTQPWASLMGMRIKGEVVRFKCIETRSWYMDHRGELAIQAAKRMSDEDIDFAEDICEKFPTLKGYEWPRGVIISVVEAFACVKTQTARDSAAVLGYTPNSWEWEELLGNFAPGRYATLTNLIKLVEPPVPFRGMPGLCGDWKV